jgi:hypothetical protein
MGVKLPRFFGMGGPDVARGRAGVRTRHIGTWTNGTSLVDRYYAKIGECLLPSKQMLTFLLMHGHSTWIVLTRRVMAMASQVPALPSLVSIS